MTYICLGVIINGNSSITNFLDSNLNYEYNSQVSRYFYRLQQETVSVVNGSTIQLTLTLWSGASFDTLSNIK